MKQKRIMAAALAAALLIGTMTACGDTDTEQLGTQDTAAKDTTAGISAEPSIYDVLQAQDYGGYEFRILNTTSNFAYTNIGEYGQTGEKLDDTIFERNNAAAEALNIQFSIESLKYSTSNSLIQNVCLAGEDAYDIYTQSIDQIVIHAMNGYVVDASEIDTLSFEHPWWNRVAIDSVMLGDSIYVFFGDLHLGFHESFTGVVFNKAILNELDLEDPYQMVHENRWTLDAMIEMMMEAKSDMDGDGKWTVNDRYPFTMYESNASIGFVVTGTSDIIPRGADNLPVWNGLDEQIVDIYNKVAGTLFADMKNNAAYAAGEVAGSTLSKYVAMMATGKTLFLITQLGVLKLLRDMEYEIGIVPMPKYDAEQENYRSNIFYGANGLAVPITNSDLDRTGVVLEHMAAYSHETVRDVYFNETLDFKYIQDEDGHEMLDLILANGYLNLSCVYGWGGLSALIMKNMNAGKTDILSKVESVSSKVESDIAATLEAFREVDAN